jgi:hypothetical protein
MARSSSRCSPTSSEAAALTRSQEGWTGYTRPPFPRTLTTSTGRVDDLLAVVAQESEPITPPAGHDIVLRGLSARWPGADRETLVASCL